MTARDISITAASGKTQTPSAMSRRLLLFAASLGILLASPLPAVDRDYVEDADFTKTVAIVFDGATAAVDNQAGVTVTTGATTSVITINSTIKDVHYILSGASSAGQVRIISTYSPKITLDGVSLTGTTRPAVSTRCAERSFFVLADGTTNTLGDTDSNNDNGALYADTGPLILSGRGALSISGSKSHAISGKTYVRVLGGDITVTGAVKDAVHSVTLFRMDHGNLTATASGDGIDGDSGSIVINGGSISLLTTEEDTKGIGCDGTITINGGRIDMTVKGEQSKGITGKSTLAINGGSLAFNMSGAVYLEDLGTYIDPAYCTAVKSTGDLAVTGGSVTITHSGLAGKGITSGGNIAISGGALDVAVSGGETASFTKKSGSIGTASADCIKADGTLTISAGAVTTLSGGTGGDCISSDLALAITGGTVSATVKGVSGDGISSDLGVSIGGGNIALAISGNSSKGIKSASGLLVTGGAITATMSGAVVLELVTTGRYDPSYCTALKTDGNVVISDGNITVTHSGLAGKGISADGNIAITGGTLAITSGGNASSTFTNTSGATDIAAADCIKADGTLTITGGAITATSTGTAGDAISCDGAAIIGTPGIENTPVITATTSGARVLVSGSGNNADYANAKALKAGGNLTINGGAYTANTSTQGAEGLESKANLVINGGTLEITAYDDAINASTSIIINDGSTYCYSSNNDGIDSNGTIRITGGIVISSGSNSPECGFDCDNSNFAITGGAIIGTGGSTSTPTAASSSQRTILYRATGTAGTVLQLRSGTTPVMTYRIPRTYSGGGGGGGGSTPMTMLINLPGLASGTTYTIYSYPSGSTVSGATGFNGYYSGSGVSVSGTATLLKTFTLGSAAGSVTTVQ